MANDKRCEAHYHELISNYLDGEISPEDRADLLQHLSECSDCRRTMQSYRAIASKLRALPAVQPPADLTTSIYQETIGSRRRRLFLLTGRVGYSVAAVAAVVLVFVIAGYLILTGYQRSIDPTVASSKPGSHVIWPQHKPIEITFNKAMDHDSVINALTISPSSEKERLNVSWDGNTLIIGENQVLKPGVSYSISIGADAADKWGQQLGQPFELQFETSDSVARIEAPNATPTPAPSPTPQPTATAEPETTPTEESAAPSPTAPATQAPTSTPLPTDPPATGPGPGEGQPAPDPTATPPASTATPSPTEVPEPTATPSPTATPEPSPTPSPTATTPPPTPTATEGPPPTPAPTSTPETVAVTDAFGSVYWGNQAIQDGLGNPTAPATALTAHELDFQHGAMLLREDIGQVYVLEAIGIWTEFAIDAGEEPTPTAGEAEGTWEPGGAIGRAWRSEPWIREAIGLALAPDATIFESQVQQFEGGSMLLSQSGQVYIVYNDGTWELYSSPAA